MTIEAKEHRNPLNWYLIVASVISDLAAVSALLASIIKQDPTLILLILAAIALFVAAAYKMRKSKFLMSRAGLIPVFGFLVFSVVLVVVAWSLLANSRITPITIAIVDPAEGGNVTLQYLVKGTVSDPNARVHVIVHPLKVSEMWVQQSPIIDGNGNWQASCTFGAETLGIGERYEVIALATNENFLVSWATGNLLGEGDKLISLPRKSNRSNLVTVTRPK
jgi:hypothetical protein